MLKSCLHAYQLSLVRPLTPRSCVVASIMWDETELRVQVRSDKPEPPQLFSVFMCQASVISSGAEDCCTEFMDHAGGAASLFLEVTH